MSPDTVALIIFTALFGVVLLALIMVRRGGSTAPAVRKQIEKLRARHDPKVADINRSRSIMLDRPQNAFDAALREILPRPDELRKRLEQTGKNLTLDKYVVICLAVLGGVTFVFSAVLKLPFLLALLVGVIAGVGLPHMVVGVMISGRINKFTSEFPEAIDLIVRGLKSGLPVIESIGVVGREMQDPIATEFRKVGDAVRLGKSLDAALWDAANRMDTPDFRFFVIALSIQQETGGNLSETLGNLSDILRRRQQLKLKIKALSSEGKASAYIIGALPFIMFGLIMVVNPDYAAVLYTDPRGKIAIGVAAVWMSIGGSVIWKMINFEF